jgi:meso-butanediol dehydrogenase/(S,S)-butanediol dehydrogenase/diacetyl reductase
VEEAGGQAISIPCDVSQPESCRRAVEQVVESLGGLAILCNIAGLGGMQHTLEVSESEWRRVMGVNLDGTFFMSQAALPHLLENRRSSIVNIASLAGLIGQAYCAAYCASKAGVVSLTKVLAVEYAKRGLRVNCICPGGVNTPILGSFAAPDEADPDYLRRLGLIPKLTRPEEVADAVAYLASDSARSINGVALPMDFGTFAA